MATSLNTPWSPVAAASTTGPVKGLLEVNTFNEVAPKGEARQQGWRAHLGLETGVNEPEIGSSERREGVRWRCTGGHAPLPTPDSTSCSASRRHRRGRAGAHLTPAPCRSEAARRSPRLAAQAHPWPLSLPPLLSLSPQAVLAAARPLQPPSHLPLCRRPRRRPRRHPRRRPRHRRLFRRLCRLRLRPSVTAHCRVCAAAVKKCV